ncbi:hypothetical protein BDZ88DRAFT_300014 [Geranomyces variabilis]|nr:hypothetical protein BDZ88DRAFT_300014 [Geranomyces variabilis]
MRLLPHFRSPHPCARRAGRWDTLCTVYQTAGGPPRCNRPRFPPYVGQHTHGSRNQWSRPPCWQLGWRSISPRARLRMLSRQQQRAGRSASAIRNGRWVPNSTRSQPITPLAFPMTVRARKTQTMKSPSPNSSPPLPRLPIDEEAQPTTMQSFISKGSYTHLNGIRRHRLRTLQLVPPGAQPGAQHPHHPALGCIQVSAGPYSPLHPPCACLSV